MANARGDGAELMDASLITIAETQEGDLGLGCWKPVRRSEGRS